jgi:glycine/D-amino acid oxidase-like deaminating enzyme
MRAAEAHGAELRVGTVTGMRQAAGRVTGVEVDGAVIDADAIVIAMGPWSILAAAWLPLPAVYGLKGHSLVFAAGDTIPPEALFLEFEEAGGAVQSPEFFPRPDGTIYVCAISSDSPLSRGRPGSGRHRAVGAHLRRRFARARCGKDCRTPGLLSPDRT